MTQNGGVCPHAEDEIAAAGTDGQNLSRGIDMPLDDVAAESVPYREGALEVEAGAGSEDAKCRAGEGFLQDIRDEAVGKNARDGEADPLNRYAFPEDKGIRPRNRKGDGERGAAIGAGETGIEAETLDEAGEHICGCGGCAAHPRSRTEGAQTARLG